MSVAAARAGRLNWGGSALLGTAVFWLALVAAPVWLPAIGSYTDLGTRVLIFALAAMGLNLVLGFTGGLSFGHAAFFGLGAYGTGLFLKNVIRMTGWRCWPACCWAG